MTNSKKSNKGMNVEEFMDQLNHPLKAEVETIREIIKKTNPEITEEIKWNAPSYSYRGEYLVTFNLRDQEKIHLVFHNALLPKVKNELLEGDYKDRRMTYFSDMKAIKTKKNLLEQALGDLIKLIDAS